MKVKKDFMLREVAGYYVVVPVGDGSLNFNGVINLNGSGAFLWKTMENDTTEAQMVAALLNEYMDLQYRFLCEQGLADL